MTNLVKYARLFADDAGESHFEDVEHELNLIDFAPPAPPLFLSSLTPAAQVGFFAAPAGWRSAWHPSPARNLFVVLSGEWEIEAGDGTVRRFRPQSILLVEDTTGKGHASRVVSKDDSLAVLIQLPT
jgi:hypothetical protein